MKRNLSFRRVFDILLAVFLSSWVLFYIIIIGNNFDIFLYSGFSGRMLSVLGALMPAVVVYMFMIIWKDITDIKAYIKKILDNKSWKRTWSTLGIFLGVHLVCVIISGTKTMYKPAYLLIYLPVVFLNSGLSEILWRGVVFYFLGKQMNFFLACMATGFINACYFIPMWMIEGASIEFGNIIGFFLYSILLSIVLGSLYRITGSLVSVILFQTAAQTLAFYFSQVRFGTPRASFMCIIEFALAIFAARFFGINAPGRGWAEPVDDDYM